MSLEVRCPEFNQIFLLRLHEQSVQFVTTTLSVLTGTRTPDQFLLTAAGRELTDEVLGSLDVAYMFSRSPSIPQLPGRPTQVQLFSSSHGEYSYLAAEAEALKNELGTYRRYVADTEHHYHLIEKGIEVLNKYYQHNRVQWSSSLDN